MEPTTIIAKSVAPAILKPLTTNVLTQLKGWREKIEKSKELQDIRDTIHAPGDGTEQALQVIENIKKRYLKFRTLIAQEKQVYLDEIYHPLSIHYHERGLNHKVDDNQLLFNENITILVGIAGQGKTTTLRKIVQRELSDENSKIIPLIITLRDVDWNSNSLSVEGIISEEFSNLGVLVKPEAIPYLLDKKALLICFDGFDEVPYKFRQKAISCISKAFNSSRCQTFVTTRPHTEITYLSGNFELASINDLEEESITAIISAHPLIDKEYKELLLRAILNNKNLSEILITPILVDIFISVYGDLDIEPKSPVDFYSNLFFSLASRHDRFKSFSEDSGFERPSKVELTIKELYKVFLRSSFNILKKFENVSVSEQDILDVFSNSAAKVSSSKHNDKAHEEISDRTSLILKEGNIYSYIHKSVLEFHAAVFIQKNKNIDNKKKIYQYLADNYDTKYEGMLRYLYEIDTPYFNEHFSLYQLNKSGILSELKNVSFSEVFLEANDIPEFYQFTIADDTNEASSVKAISYNDDSNKMEQAKRVKSLMSILNIDFYSKGVIPQEVIDLNELYLTRDVHEFLRSDFERERHKAPQKVIRFSTRPYLRESCEIWGEAQTVFENILKVCAVTIAQEKKENELDDILD
ncbi:NACHT domain-containing protein [Pseudoalteromonas agarivorans]|uniref:NACHT domain-containing protein n=1 Tax=Pseudoalteromonas agarivorans TaxID=176102 RepID=UPI00249CA531|nr:NACHT domain-containing protein [Pseudoalteromonas agarivorans]MDI3245183.1 NACHT domain-containing protein [Pseudoalteromonas agarivorans]